MGQKRVKRHAKLTGSALPGETGEGRGAFVRPVSRSEVAKARLREHPIDGDALRVHDRGADAIDWEEMSSGSKEDSWDVTVGLGGVPRGALEAVGKRCGCVRERLAASPTRARGMQEIADCTSWRDERAPTPWSPRVIDWRAFPMRALGSLFVS